jgi:hypothetical protein
MLDTGAVSAPLNVFHNPFGLGNQPPSNQATSGAVHRAAHVASRVYKHLTDDDSHADVGSIAVTLVGGVEKANNCQYRYRVVGGKRAHLVDAVIHGTIGTEDGSIQARFSTRDGLRAYSDKEVLACAANKWKLPWYMALQMARGDNSGSAALAEVWNYERDPSRKRAGGAMAGSIDRASALQFIRAFRPHLLAKVLLLEKFGTLRDAAAAGFSVRRIKRGTDRWIVRVEGEAVLPVVREEDYLDKQVFVAYHAWFDTEQEAYDRLFQGMLAWTSTFKLQDLCSALEGSDLEESLDKLRAEAESGIWSTQKMEAWESAYRLNATYQQ